MKKFIPKFPGWNFIIIIAFLASSAFISFVTPYIDYNNYLTNSMTHSIPLIDIGPSAPGHDFIDKFEGLYSKVGSFLSFLTIIILLYQIFVQYKDNRRQNAMQTYFSLIQTYIQTKNSYTVFRDKAYQNVGIRIFTTIYKDFVKAVDQYNAHNEEIEIRARHDFTSEVMRHNYGQPLNAGVDCQLFCYVRDVWQDVLFSHFRLIYHIVKTFDEDNFLNTGDKKKLARLLRSLFVPHEHILLYYNGLSLPDDKFKILIERYELLHQMPKQWIYMKETSDTARYAPEAYGSEHGYTGLVNYGMISTDE